jgi:hypothetical protein
MTKRQRQAKKVLWGILAAAVTVAGGALTYGKLALDSFTTARDAASEPQARIIKGSFQQSDFDQLVVRVSNPTGKTQSLSEPTIRCAASDKDVRYVFVAPESSLLSQSPTFPAPSKFPIQLAPGSIVETTLFVRKNHGEKSGSEGLSNCRKMRLSWLDANQKRLEGSEYSLGPNITMFVAVGAGS